MILYLAIKTKKSQYFKHTVGNEHIHTKASYLILFQQSICIDRINICYIRSLTKIQISGI